MCTVSVVGWAGGLRLVANRDEQRVRPAAIAPRSIVRDGVRAIMPIDPASGGTWITINEYGVAIALLNVNRPALGGPGVRSRGQIVARLAGLRSAGALVDEMYGLDHRAYSPFRVVGVDADEAIEIAPHLGIQQRYRLDSPLMFTSSGLGDDRVERPRRNLFERMVGRADRHHPADWRARQDAFHAHRWTDRPHLSVFMDRDDACTVSRTIVEVGEVNVWMTYSARPDWNTHGQRLTRRPV